MKHAVALGLGDCLMMGKGEESSGGRTRSSTLSDAFEALVGAMYLDSDLETVRSFVLREAGPNISSLRVEPLDFNPKGQLQEILQAISPTSPLYSVVSQSGPEHQKVFVSEVLWCGLSLGMGEGNSKKESENAAALDALTHKRWIRPNNLPITANNCE